MVVFTKYDYSDASLNKYDYDCDPLLRGKDAIIYQYLVQAGFQVHRRHVVELLNVDSYNLVNFISPFQRADCWIDQPKTSYKFYRPNLFTSNVIFFCAEKPKNRFEMFLPSKSHHGECIDKTCYGNGDCENEFYYKHAALIVEFPHKNDRNWLRRRLIILASYLEGNLLYLLRTAALDVFKLIVLQL